jgi:very-short-patch-repair endonuclease
MGRRHETWRTESNLWRKLRPSARAMRRDSTPAEAALWEHLRRGGLDGVSFRRQHPLDRFIVDFYAPALKLAVELDGGIHEARTTEDELRDQHLAMLGITVFRLPNVHVLEDLPSALLRLREVMTQRAAELQT